MSSQLNDDLWLHIFHSVIEEEGSIALFTFCSVNSYWRNLASSSPLLWTNLVVDRVAQLKSKPHFHRFISNSGTAPLFIEIDLPDYWQFDDEDIRTLELLRTCTDRVESLWLSCFDYSAVVLFFEAMGKGKAAPLLDSLYISVLEVVTDADLYFTWLSTSFAPAPNLHTLMLPSPELPDGVIANKLLSAVTSLSITQIVTADPSTAIEFVQRARHLEHFQFQGKNISSWYIIRNLDYDLITLIPTLKSIDITAPGTGTDMLRNIDAPALEHIRLDGWREYYTTSRSLWDDPQVLVQLYISVTLQRTSIRSTNLRSLHLEYIQLDKPDEEYRYILSGEWFPKLEELFMKALKITDTSFIGAASKAMPLKKLALLRCKRVTPSGLRAFVVGRAEGFLLILELHDGANKEEFRGLTELCNLELLSHSEVV